MPTTKPSTGAGRTRPRRATDVAPLELIERWMTAELGKHRAEVQTDIAGVRGDVDLLRRESREDHARVIETLGQLGQSVATLTETVERMDDDDAREHNRRELRRSIRRAVAGGIVLLGAGAGAASALVAFLNALLDLHLF